eukprot:686215-Prorocentrum_minimum.AAC.1
MELPGGRGNLRTSCWVASFFSKYWLGGVLGRGSSAVPAGESGPPAAPPGPPASGDQRGKSDRK